MNNNKEVKKHVATIHCSNGLSLIQRKICNALLFHAYDRLLQQEEHEIGVRKLCDYIGYSGNNFAVIKNAIKGLITTIMEWDLTDELTQEQDWTASSILASVRIKGALCFYAYSPRMRELLHSPAVYARINLHVQEKFGSSYGLALYENCIRYKGLSYTKWFEMPIFRKLMGVSETQYLIFRDFKRRVLDKSIAEVNQYSDIQVIPEMKKIGAKVTGIRFKIKPTTIDNENIAQENKTPLETDVKKSELIQKLILVFQMKETVIKELLATYSQEEIWQKIALIEAKQVVGKKVDNLAGFLISALKNDYQKIGSGIKKKVIFFNEIIKKEEESLQRKKAYDQYISTSIDGCFTAFSDDKKIKIINQFVTYLRETKNNLVLDNYLKNGFQSKLVKVPFQQFIQETLKTELKPLMTFAEFEQQILASE